MMVPRGVLHAIDGTTTLDEINARLAELAKEMPYGEHLYTGAGRMINEQPANPIVKHWGNVIEFNGELYRPMRCRANRSTCCCVSIRRARVDQGCRPIAIFLSSGPGCRGKGEWFPARSLTAPVVGIERRARAAASQT